MGGSGWINSILSHRTAMPVGRGVVHPGMLSVLRFAGKLPLAGNGSPYTDTAAT